ncbi:CMD domain protein [Phreatobacter aquaticus]|uniref:CMD domain protein n=1 Tax=Phreatobacter aquaticus TaxID=2570229 RepID=A0A4D7QLS4_9HYPH|nr:CMD domain protein [Phreatobacter aquaticus]QCK88155.1 CMD domain protein [Phreatobacter aquaticus]
MTDAADLIDRLAGLAPDSPIAGLRRQRPDIVARMQGAYDALFEPPDPGNLTRAERAAIGLRIAASAHDKAFAAHFRAILAAESARDHADAAEGLKPGGERLDMLMAYADLVAEDPERTDPAAMDRLRAIGLTSRDIVALTQLVAFMAYEIRVLAGLRILAEEAGQ